MTDPALLVVDHVTKVFAKESSKVEPVVAVDDVSFEMRRGEIIAIVGQSGSGKSTIGRLVLGLERPTGGVVRIGDVDLTSLRRSRLNDLRTRTHLIAQDPYQSLHPGMNIGQLIAEPLLIQGAGRLERSTRVDEALVSVGLTPADQFTERYPHELSGGQRQRVALARAFVARPDLVVADEPTSMLDASLCAGILELILEMQRQNGTAFVFITHALAIARYVATRIIILHRGRIVEVGTPD